MSVWGKILGGAAGFALSGPLGALLGTLAGHAIDNIAPFNKKEKNLYKTLAFTTGVIALSAKMAKADGKVSRQEIKTFKRLVEIPPKNIKTVGKLWELAKETTDGFENYAKQISSLFPPGSPVLERLLDLLFEIAKSDGIIQSSELLYLKTVASIFSISEKDFKCLLASHDPYGNPYAVLGVDPTSNIETIKNAWKVLVRKNHPDRLIGEGMPEEFIKSATQRLSEINSAYDSIRSKSLKI